MKYLILPFLLLAATLPAQEKGAAPLLVPSTVDRPSSTVSRAVVVGISNYQDNGIPDLQYADRDAEAFAGWLHSPAGGKIPERNLILLTNEAATLGNIVSALTGLIADSHEGEQVIIYFSGHGDVEARMFSQPGYLLCHDSKASVYMAGAFNIRDFQEVVSTLSLQNKARVLVITDACHAGKLAGSSIDGAQLTSANLAKQFANETKILSCQSTEYSLEGPQWGGGRGVFSYHLVDGLTGLADRNADDLVTLFELEMYLGEKVPEEAAPHKQFPVAIGDKTARMARVDAPALVALRQAKTGQSPMLGGTGMKGWEDDIVATTDSATRALYYAYKGALEHGALIDTAAGYQSAWTLLPQLLQRESLSELHGLLKRNLAAALQDEAQQALNALLDDDPYEANQWQYNPGKYARYPEYLARSIELLGERHYMYRTLMAKKLFFEARSVGGDERLWIYGSGATANDSLNRISRQLLENGLIFEPDAAYLNYGLGNSYFWDFARLDSFTYYHDKAIALSPAWIMPRIDILNNYLQNVLVYDWKICENYLLQALTYKPDNILLTERLAWVYQRMFRFDEAIELARKITRLRPELPNGYNTLAHTYSRLRRYELAEEYIHKTLEIDSSFWAPQAILAAKVSARTRQYEKSFQIYREGIKRGFEETIIFVYPFSHLNMYEFQKTCNDFYYAKFPGSYWFGSSDAAQNEGIVYFNKKQFREAKQQFAKSLVLLDPSPQSHHIISYCFLGRIAALEQQPDSAEYYFQKAINYYPEVFASWGPSESYPFTYFHYARFLLTQNRPADAEAQLLKAEEIDPRNPLNYLGMAALHAAQKHDTQALDWLAKALEWYYPDYDEIMAEPLFKKIRKTKRFKALMKQYFPDGSDRPKVEALARKYLPEVFGG